jgi:hypothetical protein
MTVRLHPHALERAEERGATEEQIIVAVQTGEQFPAKYGRTGFRRNFVFDGLWRGKDYHTQQIEAFAIQEEDDWLVITVIVRYF